MPFGYRLVPEYMPFGILAVWAVSIVAVIEHEACTVTEAVETVVSLSSALTLIELQMMPLIIVMLSKPTTKNRE